jgi:hypothetical protein
MQVIYELHPELIDELSLSHFNSALHSRKFYSEAVPKYHKAKCPQHFDPTMSKMQGESLQI